MKIRYPEDLDKLGTKDSEGYFLSLMTRDERLLLFTLIFTLKPKCVLEIGRSRGGSTIIISNALDQNDAGGRLISVDPEFDIEHRMMEEHRKAISHNVTFLIGPSPDVLAEAAEKAGQKFDLAFIDGDHSYEGCLRDLEGVIPHLADGACVLLHDAHFALVDRAIADARQKDPRFVDCGMISVRTPDGIDHGKLPSGEQIFWGGIRMLRFDANAVMNTQPQTAEAGPAPAELMERHQDLARRVKELNGRQKETEKRLAKLEKREGRDADDMNLRWALRHPKKFFLGK